MDEAVCSIVCYQITHCPPVNFTVASEGKNVSAQIFVQMVMKVTNYHFGSLVNLEILAASKN